MTRWIALDLVFSVALCIATIHLARFFRGLA
jgi:hypothetical protein